MVEVGQVAKEFPFQLTMPSANYGVAEHAVQYPALIDACGIDGRYVGACRTFPGFKRLGINDAYDGAGPLLVGPGIDHTTDGLAATWLHYQFKLDRTPGIANPRARSRISFFKGIEFRKTSDDTSPASLVSGFIIAFPYFEDNVFAYGHSISAYNAATTYTLNQYVYPTVPNGRKYKVTTASGVAAGAEPSWSTTVGATQNSGAGSPTTFTTEAVYNGGLPQAFSTANARRMVGFLYWDDAPYTHPTVVGASIAPGWRLRLLSSSYVTGVGSTVQLQGSLDLDCSAWGNNGYIVCPYSSGTNYTAGTSNWWGPPDDNGAIVLSSTDRVQGPAVLYYDATAKYVKLRAMSGRLSAAQVPVVTATGWTLNASAKITTPTLPGRFEFGFTFYNSENGLRSPMYFNQSADLPTAGDYYYYTANVQVHTSTWDRFDTVEVWRSALGAPGVFYRENSFTMGDLSSYAYNGAIDTSTSYRRFSLGWGRDGVSAPAARDTWNAAGLLNAELMQQAAYDGVWEFTTPPTGETTRFIVDNSVSYSIGAKGTASDDVGNTNSYFPPAMEPARLRWSSLILPRPEDYSNINNHWHPDNTVGNVYGLEKANGTIFVLGPRGIISAQPLGDRLDINQVPGFAPVNRFAYCASDSSLYVVSSKGAYQLNVAAGAVRQLDGINRIINSVDEWAMELTHGTEWQYPPIGCQYDDAGDCLFIWNHNRLEAYCFWPRTNSYTRLEGLNWQMSTRAALPEQVFGTISATTYYTNTSWVKRAYFCHEVGIEQGPDTLNDPYIDIYFPDFTPVHTTQETTGTNAASDYSMHGGPGYLDVSGTNIGEAALSGTVAAAGSATLGGYTCRYVDVAMGAVVGSSEATKLRKRLNGAILYTWDSSDVLKRAHIRDVQTTTPNTSVRYYLDDEWAVSDTAYFTSVVGGRFMVAPVVVNVTPVMIPDETKGGVAGVGQRKSIIGGSVDMDAIICRSVAGTYKTRDLTNLRAASLGWRVAESSLSTTAAFPDPYTRAEIFAWYVPQGAAYASPDRPVHGRLREVTRETFTPSRKASETAFQQFRFMGSAVAAGVEIYIVGALLELRSIRILCNIGPSARTQ